MKNPIASADQFCFDDQSAAGWPNRMTAKPRVKFLIVPNSMSHFNPAFSVYPQDTPSTI